MSANLRSSRRRCWYRCHGKAMIGKDTCESLHSKISVKERCTAAKPRGEAAGFVRKNETQIKIGMKSYAFSCRGNMYRRHVMYTERAWQHGSWTLGGMARRGCGTPNTLTRSCTGSCRRILLCTSGESHTLSNQLHQWTTRQTWYDEHTWNPGSRTIQMMAHR
jgi:hypothetical protein